MYFIFADSDAHFAVVMLVAVSENMLLILHRFMLQSQSISFLQCQSIMMHQISYMTLIYAVSDYIVPIFIN